MGGWIVGILVGLVVLDLLVHAVFAVMVVPIFERKIPFAVEGHPPVPDVERIAFPSTNSVTLRGCLYRHETRPPRGLVIFCPELEGNHWSALSYCQGLWDAGFDILAFDFRNQGESDHLAGYEPLHWLTEFEVDDVLAAIRYAKDRPDIRDLSLGLMGISRGGGAALAAASRSCDVRCIACEGAFSTAGLLLHFTLRWASLYIPSWVLKPIPFWHIRITLAITQWLSQKRRGCRYTNLERWLPGLRDRPVLMIAGSRDTYVHPEISSMLFNRIGRDHATLWMVEGAKHNVARQVDPEAYDNRLVDFFSRLSAPSTTEKLRQPAV